MRSQNRCRGSENYSSGSHLSLVKAAPARRPDIPETTVSGGCARPPAGLSTSTHNTHTPGRARHHLSAVHSSPQRASMSRNDTWHSRVRGNAPAQQPSGVPESTGIAGDSDWQRKEGSNDPSGGQPAAAVRRLHVPLPPLAQLRYQSFRLLNSCRISPLRTTAAPSALRLFSKGEGGGGGTVLSRRPGPVEMMGGEKIPQISRRSGEAGGTQCWTSSGCLSYSISGTALQCHPGSKGMLVPKPEAESFRDWNGTDS